MHRCRWRSVRGDLIAGALAAALAAGPVQVAADEPEGTVLRAPGGTAAGLGSYEFTINGQAVAESALALREPSGALLVEESAIRRWGIAIPAEAPSQTVSGVRMVRLDAFAGASHEFDEASQSIALTFPVDALRSTRFDLKQSLPRVERSRRWGGFMNYSVFGQWNEGRSNTASGLFEAGLFGPTGSGILSAIANPVTADGTSSGLVRLDTAWRVDWPDSLRTLVVGDSFTRAGSTFGRPVRIGGLQYGTNFGLQPGFITYPLQAVQGAAVAPSTVDVFVDQTRVSSQAVPPGPFSITNVPAVNGAGQVQVVVRDLFGREQVIIQSLYGTPLLLAKGITDFSVSVGAERFDYGIDSFDYRGALASGYVRHGLTDRVTVEGRADADRDVRMAGGSVDMQIGTLGIVTVGGALSESDAGTGAAVLVGFDRRSRRFGGGIRAYWADDRFRQIGDLGTSPLESLVSANLAFDLQQAGSIGVAVARQSYYGATPAVTSATATYSTVIPGLGAYASVSLSHVDSAISSTSLLLTLSIPTRRDGASVAGTVGTTRAEGRTDTLATAVAQKPAPYFTEGTGWSVYADSDRRFEAGVERNASIARMAAAASYTPGGSAVRALIEGGVGTLGGFTFASRPIRDSFAVVSTGGVPGVQVLQENQPVGVSDKNGYVVLERVLAYGYNTVSIDPESTPIGVTVDAVRQSFSPGWRSGEFVEFPVRRERNAVIRVNLPSGEPVPAGASVAVDGVPGTTVTGHGGRIFVVGLPDGGATLSIILPDGPCVVRVGQLEKVIDTVAVLGPYVCGAVKQ